MIFPGRCLKAFHMGFRIQQSCMIMIISKRNAYRLSFFGHNMNCYMDKAPKILKCVA